MIRDTRTALTQILWHLPTPQRVEYRRRINAMVDSWADYMQAKYGPGAIRQLRLRMIQTTKRDEHFRNHLWSRVYRKLRG